MRDQMDGQFPVDLYVSTIKQKIQAHKRVIVTAPPGSGKSTRIPLCFLGCSEYKSIIVLQPRRLAARHLAAYCAIQHGSDLGNEIGYSVRFEKRCSQSTRLCFQTYGVFLNQLLENQFSLKETLVILDEFHERSIEIDCVLSLLMALTDEKYEVPFIVMSATLVVDRLEAYIRGVTVSIAARCYPVAIHYLEELEIGSVEDRAVLAVKKNISFSCGSILIFMPGIAEIRSTCRKLEEIAERYSMPLLQLHGTVPLDQQIGLIEQTKKQNCIIVSTNVAETSLTISGVKIVIDSGLSRSVTYDPLRERNSLTTGMISRFNAEQRTGRAGRVAPGTCIRLWSREREKKMADTIIPEVCRLELSGMVLMLAVLCKKASFTIANEFFVTWLDTPDKTLWSHGITTLESLGIAVRQHGNSCGLDINNSGYKIVNLGVHPVAGVLLITSRERGCFLLAAAVVALWESAGKQSPHVDIVDTAIDLVTGVYGNSSLMEQKSYCKLSRLLPNSERELEVHAIKMMSSNEKQRAQLKENVIGCFAKTLKEHIGLRDGNSVHYLFKNKRIGVISVDTSVKAKAELPDAVISLTFQEQVASSRSRQSKICQWISLSVELLEKLFPKECHRKNSVAWNSDKRIVTASEKITFNEIVVEKNGAVGSSKNKIDCAAVLVSQIIAGVITVFDEPAYQLVYRIRLANTFFPEYSFPCMDSDDLELLYNELCEKCSSEAELLKKNFCVIIAEYMDKSLINTLDYLFPSKWLLPSGRSAKIIYFEKSSPEITARLGDFIGSDGLFTVGEGRVPCIYTILAPNYRVVQKTSDLKGFWKNTYPEIKKELMRRYPKHPWP